MLDPHELLSHIEFLFEVCFIYQVDGQTSNDMIRRLQQQTHEVANILRDNIDKLAERNQHQHQTPEVVNILRDDTDKLVTPGSVYIFVFNA